MSRVRVHVDWAIAYMKGYVGLWVYVVCGFMRLWAIAMT